MSGHAVETTSTTQNPEAEEEQTGWICTSCLQVYLGTHEVASKHFEDQWGHWLVEVQWSAEDGKWKLTGKEIHTSDAGGYYRSPADLNWIKIIFKYDPHTIMATHGFVPPVQQS